MLVFFFFFFIVSSFATGLTQSVPTYKPTTSEHVDYTTLNSTAPLEFPALNQNYPFVDNSSIRANLASHSENDTEVDDLLGQGNNTKESAEMSGPLLILPMNGKPNPSEQNEDLESKRDTEWIENGQDTEDDKFYTTEVVPIVPKVVASTSDNTSKETWSLFDGHIAAILAGTFLIISVFAYAALLLWRQFLESRYGSREMLVNEDEFIDPDDMKHFSVQSVDRKNWYKMSLWKYMGMMGIEFCTSFFCPSTI